MIKWERLESVNAWTGEVSVRHIARVHTSDRKARVYMEVSRVDAKYQWRADIFVMHEPTLTRMAYGSLAVTPYSLPVAKMRAARLAMRAIRNREPLTRAA